MAEVNLDSGGGRKGRKRGNKVSTKIDMTPMVDLAFLLITFFMLTTTFSKPQSMELNMPKADKNAPKTDVPNSKAMTIILGDKHKVYYYNDALNPDVQVTDFSEKGIRKVLTDRLRSTKDLIVVIKPDDTSKYKDMVDMLDEIHITETKRFAVAKITAKDKELIKGI